MDCAASYLKMLTAIEQTIDSLLAQGDTQDALVLLTSESIIRHHLGPRLLAKSPALLHDQTIFSSPR
jgi:hypothetical protein